MQLPLPSPSFTFENAAEGEIVHQRCLLLKGSYNSNGAIPESCVVIETTDGRDKPTFPPQTWPVINGRVKAMVMLSPGANTITVVLDDKEAAEPTATRSSINLTYLPLLQTPPLHLAIMVAKDSPLLIDCPAGRYSAVSSAHSSLDAAIAKFRMTAYMWQAMTAEDMRLKGLGRRAFRFDEEWNADTTSLQFVTARHDAALAENGAMRSTAKIHIVRSERTVAEIRSMKCAQQNPRASKPDSLHEYFKEALVLHGGPFESSCQPVVAGLILDTHYSMQEDIILGHAALGSHDNRGISLGIMGSHLTYSWPRFLEEVVPCLTDDRNPGNTVGNDARECGSFWEACAYWPRNFLVRTAYCTKRTCDGVLVTDGETVNEAVWDLRDALSFRAFPHFWLPDDISFSPEARVATPTLTVDPGESQEEACLVIASAAGLIRNVSYLLSNLETRFDRELPLSISVLGLNGKSRMVKNAWQLFASESFIRVRGTNLVLHKQSVASTDLQNGEHANTQFWKWATLLQKRAKGKDGFARATKIDVRTGCILDGAYVYYSDKERVNCGPRIGKWGGKHTFGGHASEKSDIPKNAEIVKVEVSRESYILHGIRLTLSNGTVWGQLDGDQGDGAGFEVIALEPSSDETIVGFFGQSWWGSHCDGLVEFGIITAPKNTELPEAVYDMDELKNTDGGVAEDGKVEDVEDMSEDMSEDEDMD
ncbi:unnamed protein product [Parascedosporium putredinis]|uniref:Jacalin-type lectin domain-containing protein n=1 Tax=Parascedosporium putredinis TaxID=1442378 RepID=A0A9P1MDI8_9PEZI|nr:unnamed protein product [Parascedosporium putredinis]CAI8002737.1 unnamed protein product [Parascedosporium putredinis]